MTDGPHPVGRSISERVLALLPGSTDGGASATTTPAATGLKQGVLAKVGKRWGVRRDVFVAVHADGVCVHAGADAGSAVARRLPAAALEAVEASEAECRAPHAFRLRESTRGRTALFAARSREEREAWITAVRCVAALAAPPPAGGPTPTRERAAELVRAVDALVPRLCGAGGGAPPRSPFERTPAERAQTLGQAALTVAAAAAATRATPAARRALAAALLALLRAIRDAQQHLLASPDPPVAATEDLFLRTSSFLSDVCRSRDDKNKDKDDDDETLPQQIQHAAILVERAVERAGAAATAATGEETLDAAAADVVRETRAMVEAAQRWGVAEGRELPLFAAPAVLLAAQDLALACADCAVLAPAAVVTYLAAPTRTLTDALAKLAAVSQPQPPPSRTLRTAINEALALARVDNEQEEEEQRPECVLGVMRAAAGVLEALEGLQEDMRAADVGEAVGARAGVLRQAAGALAGAAQALGSHAADAVQHEAFQQHAGAALRRARALAAALTALSAEHARPQAAAIRIACASVTLADAVTAMLRAGFTLRLEVARTGTAFDSDAGFDETWSDSDDDALALDDYLASSSSVVPQEQEQQKEERRRLQPPAPLALPPLKLPGEALTGTPTPGGQDTVLSPLACTAPATCVGDPDPVLCATPRADEEFTPIAASRYRSVVIPRALLEQRTAQSRPRGSSVCEPPAASWGAQQSSSSNGDTDVNIWDEPADNPGNIVVDAQTGVRAANLNKLVERLTMVGEQDITYQKTFITAYRSFTTPARLFDKLMERYEVRVPHLPPSVAPGEYHRLFVLPVQLRIINVLKQWMEASFDDFDAALVARVRAFVTRLQTSPVSDTYVARAAQLTRILNNQIAAQERERLKQRNDQASISATAAVGEQTSEQNTFRERSPSTSTPRATLGEMMVTVNDSLMRQQQQQQQQRPARQRQSSLSIMPLSREVEAQRTPLWRLYPAEAGALDADVVPARAMDVFRYTAQAVAEQLTFYDAHYFGQIRPYELLSQRWSRQREQSPHVAVLTERFNEVSRWCAALVLAQRSAGARAAVWQRLIAVAECLQRLNNFNSLLAMLAAFNSAAVYRLRATRALLPAPARAWYAAAMRLMNADGAYRHYREALRTARTPLLPYLGVALTDLTFIEDGNPDTVGGLVNFRKRQLVHGVIADIQLYQQTPYRIAPDPALLALLHTLPALDDDSAYRISLLREPRSTSFSVSSSS